EAMSSVTSCIARFSPYQIDMFFTWNVDARAVSLFEGTSPNSTPPSAIRSDVGISKFSIDKSSHGRCPTAPSQNSNQHINAENTGDEHEGAGPSLAMPIFVGRNGVCKNLQRQCGDRLSEAMVPETIAESGKEKRRCFAPYSGESEQNSSDDSLGRGLHHDVYD